MTILISCKAGGGRASLELEVDKYASDCDEAMVEINSRHQQHSHLVSSHEILRSIRIVRIGKNA